MTGSSEAEEPEAQEAQVAHDLPDQNEWPYLPVLLSAGVWPGAGQWLQGHKARALVLGVGSLGGIGWAMARVVLGAAALAAERGGAPASAGEWVAVFLEAGRPTLPIVVGLGVLWLAGIADAFVTVHRQAASPALGASSE